MTDKNEILSNSDWRHEPTGSKPADRSKAKRVTHQLRSGGVTSAKSDKPNIKNK